jgi:hypothetical protein
MERDLEPNGVSLPPGKRHGRVARRGVRWTGFRPSETKAPYMAGGLVQDQPAREAVTIR